MKNPYVGIQRTVFAAGYRAAMKDMHKFAKGIKDTTPDVPKEGHVVLRGTMDTIMSACEELTKEE
jgi:hypothetical protein